MAMGVGHPMNMGGGTTSEPTVQALLQELWGVQDTACQTLQTILNSAPSVTAIPGPDGLGIRELLLANRNLADSLKGMTQDLLRQLGRL